ncbi:hypothetical protein BpHYR1_019807 [Brachionus plicatilis]|uniref:Uncharacterized protein n=1 Tax=Brachionus plicatilis TaxID=10195 RepID=A0A3M7SY39_BRAPC|nr:hypothetical protein BpHYR1_019807 [Brachionus plicatilis]
MAQSCPDISLSQLTNLMMHNIGRGIAFKKPQLGRFWELERQSWTSSTLFKINIHCAHLYVYFFQLLISTRCVATDSTLFSYCLLLSPMPPLYL